ncbi:MAG: hypothetical protein A2V65_03200 [Deltaproteobacteria bacterium RBG_13_49_15]|nr:MAG: hypothetical protein A2V65_03200 [Deltaproteobacteria bacterium RBG_13_49_15]
MKEKNQKPFKGLILVSTPWPLYNRPSIQIGALKSYIGSRFPKIHIEARHSYLAVAEGVGYPVYHALSERTWLAETVYAAMLFPEKSDDIEKLFRSKRRGSASLKRLAFAGLVERVKEITESEISRICWEAFDLAGFSICLCQLSASLYFIRQIKKAHPGIQIVVGGSTFSGVANRNFFNVFPEIDGIISGEGELPLSKMISHLIDGNESRWPDVPGVSRKNDPENRDQASFQQMKDLAALPIPDYSDYFEMLKTFTPKQRFFPVLPAEISRGCLWRKASPLNGQKGCAFCNLNLQWAGYRTKEAKQVAAEVNYLTSTHKVLSIAFADNLIPERISADLFKSISEQEKDYHLFCEVRATTPKKLLTLMKEAGVRELQVGIEALSSSLLKKINKGTSAILNLEIMKRCEELGIQNVSNLILCFPGSDRIDVEETLRCLEVAYPYRPLKGVHFWLGIGSPAWKNPSGFGISAVFNHPNYARLFPSRIAKGAPMIIQGYRGDLNHQRKLWRPVRERLRWWKKIYDRLKEDPSGEPILSYRDGRDFLLIRQKTPDARILMHRLVKTSRMIYLYCDRHRSLSEILNRFEGFSQPKVMLFLKLMVDQKLMFCEADRYLSLAIPVRSHPAMNSREL